MLKRKRYCFINMLSFTVLKILTKCQDEYLKLIYLCMVLMILDTFLNLFRHISNYFNRGSYKIDMDMLIITAAYMMGIFIFL